MERHWAMMHHMMNVPKGILNWFEVSLLKIVWAIRAYCALLYNV